MAAKAGARPLLNYAFTKEKKCFDLNILFINVVCYRRGRRSNQKNQSDHK